MHIFSSINQKRTLETNDCLNHLGMTSSEEDLPLTRVPKPITRRVIKRRHLERRMNHDYDNAALDHHEVRGAVSTALDGSNPYKAPASLRSDCRKRSSTKEIENDRLDKSKRVSPIERVMSGVTPPNNEDFTMPYGDTLHITPLPTECGSNRGDNGDEQRTQLPIETPHIRDNFSSTDEQVHTGTDNPDHVLLPDDE